MLDEVVEPLLVGFVGQVLLDAIHLLLNLVLIKTCKDWVHLGLFLLHHVGDGGSVGLLI